MTANSKTTSVSCAAALACHPGSYSQAVYGIEAGVCWTEHGALGLTYVLKGDISRLRIPPPRPPRRADRLWQHTCFEVFVAMKGKPEYYEFNFAPSSEWAVYAFRSYREGEPLADEDFAPKITARSAGDSLILDANIRLDRHPKIFPLATLRLGLSAVIEENDSTLSYWALKHPPGKPDFHHPDAFALEIQPFDVDAFDDSAYTEKP